jgi:hypothetical protein
MLIFVIIIVIFILIGIAAVWFYMSMKKNLIQGKDERDRVIELAFNSLRELQEQNQATAGLFKIKSAMPISENLQNIWVVRLDSQADSYLFTIDSDSNQITEVTHQM